MVKIRVFLIIVFITLLLMEIGLRIIGKNPISDYPVVCVFGENGSFHEKSDLLGFTNRPGSYSCRCEFDGDELAWVVTNKEDNSRITSLESSFDTLDNKILFLGCSFTYGHGLNDSATAAWKIQEKLTNIHVINNGITATGTLHAYLILKESLKSSEIPKIVLYNYGSIHNERNVMAWRWWQPIWDYKEDVLVDNVFPFAILENDSLIIKYKNARDFYPLMPFRRVSAFSAWIEDMYNGYVSNKVDSYQVTLELILQMKRLLDERGIDFVVPYFSNDMLTLNMVEDLNKRGVTTLDLNVENQRGNYLKEWDKHPSSKANTLFAEKLLKYLSKESELSKY